MPAESMPRRQFLKTATVAAGGIAALARTAIVHGQVLGANDRVNLGIVGCGVRGTDAMIPEAQSIAGAANVGITAVCDVWRLRRERGAAAVEKALGTKPNVYTRYEQLLEDKNVDAITIDTPDVWHMPILLDALRAGKDVYVEKPMATRLDEAQQAVKLTRELKRVVQVGTQRRSEPRFQVAADFVKTGKLGRITMVECGWNDVNPRWLMSQQQIDAVKPEDVDWAAYTRILPHDKPIPFNPHYLIEWKMHWLFTTGVVGLLGSHMIDVVHWIMDDLYPTSCVALGGVYLWSEHDRQTEDTAVALFEYPKKFLLKYTTRFGNSCNPGPVIYGTNGTLYTDKLLVTGEGGGKNKIAEKIKLEAPPAQNHLKNFVDCVRSRKDPNAPIEVGYAHSVCAIMAEKAERSGKRVLYDAATQEIREG